MAIKLTDLSHIYHSGTANARVALRNVTLEITTGVCLGIAGASGSGKTTLIQHLSGILQAESGSVTIDGSTSRDDLRRRVGIVFQYPEQQFFEETVAKEVGFALSGRGLSRDDIAVRVRAALGAVGLGEELLELSPFSLSGGEKRRLAIASILIGDPEVLVLDEPGAGLDPRGRREIFDFLAKIRREAGLTLIIVSHNMEDLARLADRMLILYEGAVVREGCAREVFHDHQSLERAGLVPPQITTLMRKLKESLPEIREGILTVAEAHAELKRVLALRAAGHGVV